MIRTAAMLAVGLMACASAYAAGDGHCTTEKLDRGLVALPASGKGVFLSWRLLGSDDPTTTFMVVRDGT